MPWAARAWPPMTRNRTSLARNNSSNSFESGKRSTVASERVHTSPQHVDCGDTCCGRLVSPIAEETVLGFLECDDFNDAGEAARVGRLAGRLLDGHMTTLGEGCVHIRRVPCSQSARADAVITAGGEGVVIFDDRAVLPHGDLQVGCGASGFHSQPCEWGATSFAVSA